MNANTRDSPSQSCIPATMTSILEQQDLYADSIGEHAHEHGRYASSSVGPIDPYLDPHPHPHSHSNHQISHPHSGEHAPHGRHGSAASHGGQHPHPHVQDELTPTHLALLSATSASDYTHDHAFGGRESGLERVSDKHGTHADGREGATDGMGIDQGDGYGHDHASFEYKQEPGADHAMASGYAGHMHAHDPEAQHQEVKPEQKGGKGSKGKGKAGVEEGEDGKVRRTRQSREYWSGPLRS